MSRPPRKEADVVVPARSDEASEPAAWLAGLATMLDAAVPSAHVEITSSGALGAPAVVVIVPRRALDDVLRSLRSWSTRSGDVRVVYWSVQRGSGARFVAGRRRRDGAWEPARIDVRVGAPRRGRTPTRPNTRAAGLNIVLYGPDGVGKSTAAQALADALRDLGVPDAQVSTYHAFVATDRLDVHSKARTTAVKARTYAHARRSGSRAPLLVLAYLKRLGLRWLRLRPRVRAGLIAVHDRYLFDVFLKAQKVHGDLPLVERAMARLAPTDDLVFVLRADPETVSARTGELSPPQVRAAYELLDRCLAASRVRHVDIDATKPHDVVVTTLVEHTLERQTERLRRSS